MNEATLSDCPIGLFWSANGELCLKTEYGNNEGRIDAYIVSTGEFFWGSAPQTIENQRRQLVRPIDTDDALERLSAQQREPVVRVKELVWRQSSGGDDPVVKGVWWADTTLGRYIARENTADGSGWFLFRQPVWNKTESLDEAKSAAQADYEQRIMAAICREDR